MKKLILVLLTIALLLNVAYAKQMQTSTNRKPLASPLGYRMPPRRNIPDYNFSKLPTSIMTSYYDYMIGSYNGLPLRVIPPSAGGGYFMTYHGRRAPTGVRRVFYSYLDANGYLVANNEITNMQNNEGYPAMAVDPISGKPLYAWHANTDADAELEVQFVSDAFLSGFSGLWNDAQVIINNPTQVTHPNGTVTYHSEFIWPSMQIGPSPIAGKRRVYVLARNGETMSYGPCENPYIAFADFNANDIENAIPLVWSHTSIPEMDQWNIDAQWRRPFHSLTVDNAGNLYYAGYHFATEADGDTAIDEEDLDIFICPNYGQGQWARLSFWDKLPTWNPPTGPSNPTGYFENSDTGLPYTNDQLTFNIANSSHLNAAIDQHGRVHVLCVYALSTYNGYYYPNLQYVKEFVYDPATQQVTVNEVHPKKPADDHFNPYFTPWDIETPYGVVDEFAISGDVTAPMMVTDFPFPHWDQTAHSDAMLFHYNNLKISNANDQGMMVAVWQNSYRARMYNEYNDSDYAAFTNTPEIWISVSPNNGDYWSEPIVLNNVETPQFANIKPMWVYPADKVVYTGMQGQNKVGKVGLMFYNDYTWGSHVIDPPYHPNSDGGQVMFTELEIVFPESDAPLEDPFDDPLVLSGSMTVMAEVTINGAPASSNDILAAFVTVNGQEQLRGKENIMVVDGVAGCLIQIFTETNGENISFKVWDYDRQLVLSAYPGVTSQLNGVVGSWPDDMYHINAGSGTQTVENPVFNPPAGDYTSPQNIILSCPTSGAQIRYTTTGSEPTENSALYVEPIHLPENTIVTIKAKAFKENLTPSLTVSAHYVITGTVATPTITPPGGYYTTPQYVVLDCPTSYAQIRYTMDGTEPSQTSFLYTAPINLSTNSNYTITAKAYKVGWVPSSSVYAEYNITGTVTPPIFDPPAGMYMGEVEVSINCPSPNANIHYTLDGSTPDVSSAQYAEPITITEDTTIKAIAIKTDWVPSDIIEASYQIIPVSNPDDTQTPLFTGIHNVYPNPFSDTATIRIGLKGPNQDYQLSIYNLKGQRVHQYVGKAKGFQDYHWDGRDAFGKKLPAGIYFLRMKTPTETSIKKIVRQ